MTQLIWNDIGERYFETGVDRGVFYKSDGSGVAWNGLTAIKESPSGVGTTPYYLDGVKYLNVANTKEFTGSIEAYTYPDEFAEYDGWAEFGNGLTVDEQKSKSFGLSYRTGIGNDLDGQDHGYKIHLVWNALAVPSDISHASISENVDPLNFSWSFTTTPIRVDGFLPLSHVIIDSTKTNPTQLKFIEDYLYGTPDQEVETDTYFYVIPGQTPTMPSLEEVLTWFADPMVTRNILADPTTGLSLLVDSPTAFGDLKGRRGEGLYVLTDGTRFNDVHSPDGLNSLTI
jgi:hypothetical protein